MSGVTDIGQKSGNPIGLGTLGTGVTKAFSQYFGLDLREIVLFTQLAVVTSLLLYTVVT